ncbi:MAG: hypothetical protein VKJ24_12655 [Synechococcales bacterium]|nr:hypothetical protein [Synechococcales bacterium]
MTKRNGIALLIMLTVSFTLIACGGEGEKSESSAKENVEQQEDGNLSEMQGGQDVESEDEQKHKNKKQGSSQTDDYDDNKKKGSKESEKDDD